jgi:hypothetical protein
MHRKQSLYHAGTPALQPAVTLTALAPEPQPHHKTKEIADIERRLDHLEHSNNKLKYALQVFVADPLRPMPVSHETRPKGCRQ